MEFLIEAKKELVELEARFAYLTRVDQLQTAALAALGDDEATVRQTKRSNAEPQADLSRTVLVCSDAIRSMLAHVRENDGEAVLQVLVAACDAVLPITDGITKDQQHARIDACRPAIEGVYKAVWATLENGASADETMAELSHLGFLLGDDRVDADVREKLKQELEELREIESNLTLRAALGDAEYAVVAAQRSRMESIRGELLSALEGKTSEEIRAYVADVQKLAQPVREKAMAALNAGSSQEEVVDSLETSEMDALYRAEILEALQGANAEEEHAHSHGGGHGHSHGGHGHSHGGKPCEGH